MSFAKAEDPMKVGVRKGEEYNGQDRTSQQTKKREIYIKRAVSIRGECTKGHDLGAAVGHRDLKVAIRIFLLQDETHCFFDIDKELARLEGLLVYSGNAVQLVMLVIKCRITCLGLASFVG